MTYVDVDQFLEYCGKEEDAPEFEGIDLKRQLYKATEHINFITKYRANFVFGKHKHIDKYIKKAVCAMAEYYIRNNGYDAYTRASESEIMDVRIGEFSYKAGGTNSKDGDTFIFKTPLNVIGFLEPTGLLHEGVK